ncbi:MAG: PAS domain-containing sensor histidine kinase [Planctomycetes bacterium]|nr:PAS domain-containing sensor histidine kinase [Planctomycetota bacterium]
MHDLLDTAPCGFASFTDDGAIVLANTTLATMLGYRRDEIEQRTIEQLFTVGARVFHQTHFFPLLKLHGKAEEIYLTLLGRDGKDVPVLVNAVRRDRDGRPANDCTFFCVPQRAEYEDRLLRAKQEAEAATRARDEMLAVVSHELRSPLNAILGWTQVMRMQLEDPKTIASGLDTIERNVRTQSRLIEDLLDVSRLVAGKLRLAVDELDPVSVIEAAIEVVRPAAEANSIRIRPTLDRDAGRVSGDADRLQQVLWNLLSNAVKFSPENGVVELALRRVGATVEITVADHGCGIAPEFLPYVFDRFRQAPGADSPRKGGLGLGLAITKAIVELHGGWIRARSDGEGRGAEFVVSLPALTQPAAAGPDGAREAPTGS